MKSKTSKYRLLTQVSILSYYALETKLALLQRTALVCKRVFLSFIQTSLSHRRDTTLISRTPWSCPLRAEIKSFLCTGVNPVRFRKTTDSLGDVESQVLRISCQTRITPGSSKCDLLARRPTVAFTIANCRFAPALGCRRRPADSCVLCYGSKVVIIRTWCPSTTC